MSQVSQLPAEVIPEEEDLQTTSEGEGDEGVLDEKELRAIATTVQNYGTVVLDSVRDISIKAGVDKFKEAVQTAQGKIDGLVEGVNYLSDSIIEYAGLNGVGEKFQEALTTPSKIPEDVIEYLNQGVVENRATKKKLREERKAAKEVKEKDEPSAKRKKPAKCKKCPAHGCVDLEAGTLASVTNSNVPVSPEDIEEALKYSTEIKDGKLHIYSQLAQKGHVDKEAIINEVLRLKKLKASGPVNMDKIDATTAAAQSEHAKNVLKALHARRVSAPKPPKAKVPKNPVEKMLETAVAAAESKNFLTGYEDFTNDDFIVKSEEEDIPPCPPGLPEPSEANLQKTSQACFEDGTQPLQEVDLS